MISSYGDQVNHQGIILHIIIVLSTNAASIVECFQRHLMFYTCNYNIRVTHGNGAIKHILHESDPRSDYQQIVSMLFLSLRALALHLALKYYFKSSLYEDLSTLALHTSVGCISSRMPAGTALCYATNTIK